MIELCDKCGARFPTGRLEACPVCLLAAIDVPTVAGLEIGEEIGRGGMGAVYRAKHLRLGRTVAVKMLPPELAAQPEFKSRFEREARTLALLNHPNIVTVHDAGQDGDQPYIVMECIEGQSLQVPQSPARTVEIIVQVCDALTYAHGQGVVHRDIKPENILIEAGGRVKVTDFGIARLLPSAGKKWTVTTEGSIGTPHYMAPEAMENAPPDPRMDIYSLGVLLYQTVMGKLPVGSFEPAPPPIDAVVRKALSADPARRYATADEMKRALVAGPVEDELPSDEMTWVRAVAMLQSVSTGVAIWAFLVSVTPKTMNANERLPLIMIGEEKLPDGRILSRARFEMWPTVAAVATFAIAILAYGLLRRHWRLAGLERPQPERPVPEAKTVLYIGIFACIVYGFRRMIEDRSIAQYIPVFGAVIEIAALYYLWVTILKAWRIGRPLRREPKLWLGFAIALIPPATDLVRNLVAWKP